MTKNDVTATRNDKPTENILFRKLFENTVL